METRAVDATCIHSIRGGPCETCRAYTTEPVLPVPGMYEAPERVTDTIKREATGPTFHGPDTRRRIPTFTSDRSTLDRINRSAAERERTRKRHDYTPGGVTLTCHEDVETPQASELDTFLADWAERLGVSL